MKPMRWFLLLPVLLVLSLDFATLDAPLAPLGSRHAQADDEEESVPSRTLRVRRVEPSAAATLPAHRRVAPSQVRRLLETAARAFRRNDSPPWIGPIARARLA